MYNMLRKSIIFWAEHTKCCNQVCGRNHLLNFEGTDEHQGQSLENDLEKLKELGHNIKIFLIQECSWVSFCQPKRQWTTILILVEKG